MIGFVTITNVTHATDVKKQKHCDITYHCYVTITIFISHGPIVMVLLTNHQFQVRQDPSRGFDEAETLGLEIDVVFI